MAGAVGSPAVGRGVGGALVWRRVNERWEAWQRVGGRRSRWSGGRAAGFPVVGRGVGGALVWRRGGARWEAGQRAGGSVLYCLFSTTGPEFLSAWQTLAC